MIQAFNDAPIHANSCQMKAVPEGALTGRACGADSDAP
jgi:hypothetical protein